MAVKKKVEKAVETEVNVEVQVETPVEDVVETNEGVESAETPEVEIEEAEVNVDLSKTAVDNSKKPEGKVKIKMRVNHRCTIAMERYDLEAGKTYVVPRNVKNILNRAGLLAPL